MKVKEYKITDLDRKKAIEFVEAAKQYSKSIKKLVGFGQRFQVCAHNLNEVHIFDGIEKLALSLGVAVLDVKRSTASREPHQKQFVYDGIEFFQLCSAEEKYIGTYREFKEIKLKVRECKQ